MPSVARISPHRLRNGDTIMMQAEGYRFFVTRVSRFGAINVAHGIVRAPDGTQTQAEAFIHRNECVNVFRAFDV